MSPNFTTPNQFQHPHRLCPLSTILPFELWSTFWEYFIYWRTSNLLVEAAWTRISRDRQQRSESHHFRYLWLLWMAKRVHMTDLWRLPWIEGVKFKRQHPSEARRKYRREDHLACVPRVVSTVAGASTISSTNRTTKPAGRANPPWCRASRDRCSLCSWRTLRPSKTPRTTSLALSPPEARDNRN